MKSLHHKTFSICMILDPRKAFDAIDVGWLISKLNMCGVRGTLQQSY